MEGDKLWVQIVSIDTPSSSHRSALPHTQICLLAHHEPSASQSQGQPGQLRRRGWAERRPKQAPSTAPCARRRLALYRKAVGAVDGQGKMQLEIGKLRIWEALKAPVCLLPSSCPHHAPCHTRALPPRCASTGSRGRQPPPIMRAGGGLLHHQQLLGLSRAEQHQR